MTAVTREAMRIDVDKSGRPRSSPIIPGDDNSALRGLWAKNLLRHGLRPARIAGLMKVGRSQLYRDLEAASRWIERELAEVG